MNKLIKFTKKIIDKLEYDKGWDVRWDEDLAGFGIRIYPSGKKSFVLSYRSAGRKRLMVLGSYGTLTVEQAKIMAKSKLNDVINGQDPAEIKRHSNQINSFADFCSVYIERHAKKHKKTWQEDQRKINKRLLPLWKNRSLESITKTDVAFLHSNIGKAAPYEANRTINLLATMFELAKQWGFLEENHSLPTKYIKMFKEEKRDRWVTPDELPRLISALEKEENIYARFAIWLYLLTGLRKSELLKAKWSDIDSSRKELRLEETKAGRIHYIPLSKPCMELLTQIPKQQENPYILPGQITGKALVNISKPWNRIRKEANLENVRLHDLRRTVGSWLAQSGNSLHLIGKVLNHSNQSTTAVYARFAQDHVREALENHGKLLIEAANKKHL